MQILNISLDLTFIYEICQVTIAFETHVSPFQVGGDLCFDWGTCGVMSKHCDFHVELRENWGEIFLTGRGGVQT